MSWTTYIDFNTTDLPIFSIPPFRQFWPFLFESPIALLTVHSFLTTTLLPTPSIFFLTTLPIIAFSFSCPTCLFHFLNFPLLTNSLSKIQLLLFWRWQLSEDVSISTNLFFVKSGVKGNVFEIPCSHYFIHLAWLFHFMDFGWKARTFSKCSLMQPFHSVLLARGVFCLLYLQLCLVSFSSLLFFIPLSFVCTAAYAWVFRMRHTSLSGRIRISDTQIAVSF